MVLSRRLISTPKPIVALVDANVLACPVLMMKFYLPTLHSELVARLLHHRSAHNTNTNLIMLADVMAPGLLINRSAFFAGGNISPVLPTNVL
jgi:hypothetical protein